MTIKEPKPAPLEEVADIQRKVLVWLNSYPNSPVPVIRIEPMLYPKEDGIVLITINGSLTGTDILGGHTGEYQFALQYRFLPGTSLDKRLDARENLNFLGSWAANNLPEWDNIRPTKCVVTQQAELLTPYEGGDEDLQILMRLEYEVI